MKTALLASLALLVATACGDDTSSDGDTGDAGDADAPDGGDAPDDGMPIDAPPTPPQGCTEPVPGNPQCSNCIDDDGDGYIDVFDIHCSGPLDNNEASFSTGIPGDNIDAVNQDCFFDGNSGAGNDGCSIHVCCLLGAATVEACPIGANQYDPAECPPPLGTEDLSQQCIETCGALTPPGCDCFGCCTVCDPADPSQCYDIITNPNVSPNCTEENLDDPTQCVRCTQTESCGPSECGGDTCILCPGQSPEDLPDTCNETACPVDSPSCADGVACPDGSYCGSSFCCISVVGRQQ